MSLTNDGVRSSRPARIRQQQILDTLEQAGHVEVSELSGVLYVTEETIRRDLRRLERDGHLQRAHGGAIKVDEIGNDFTSLLEAEIDQLPIAAEALKFIPDAGSIYLDSGRLTESLASMLTGSSGLRVVTSSIYAALAASRNGAIDVYNLGGEVGAVDGAQSGQWTREEIARVQVDVAFITATGISRDVHITTETPKSASIKKAAIDTAGFVVLLIDDEDAFDTAGLVKFAPLSAVDVVIVGADAPASLISLIRASGPTVNVASEDQEKSEEEA